jgi:hypothetical protein
VIIAVASALQLVSASVTHPSKLDGSETHKYAVVALQGLLILRYPYAAVSEQDLARTSMLLFLYLGWLSSS